MSDVEITPVENKNYVLEANGYQRLGLTSEQKIHMSALSSQLPSVVIGNELASAPLYKLEFPSGVNGSLMNLKVGGNSTTIVGTDGRIVGTASLHETNAAVAATVMQAFTIMSIASSQYFLAEINSKLSKISKGIDQILEFLYGDKKAELLSEISFTKYVYQNYISIASHDEQRVATIGSLQQSKKVAMKDIEFYLSDLESLITLKDGSKLSNVVQDSFRVKDSLDLSIQLFVMSTILEVYYSQNFDESYISNIEEETYAYISKCDKQILGAFAVLQDNVKTHKSIPLEKFNKVELIDRIGTVVDSLSRGEEAEIKKFIHCTLYSFNRRMSFCVDETGETYLKTA